MKIDHMLSFQNICMDDGDASSIVFSALISQITLCHELISSYKYICYLKQQLAINSETFLYMNIRMVKEA